MAAPTGADAMAAVRCIPHPRGLCGCPKCDIIRDEQNNRAAWTVVREEESHR